MRIDNAVLNVLDAAQISGEELRLTGQLDRKLYLKTNEVLEAAGGKWNRKAKAHIFPSDARELMEQIILAGEITRQQELGYFPTPRPIAERLIELADIQPGMRVLEPSAGTGNIATLIPGGCIVHCYELQEKHVQMVRAKGLSCVPADFLTIDPQPIFDRVVMNPPFAKQDDIKHVNHALEFLKPDGTLVSVMSAGVMFRENKLTKDFRALVERRGGEFEEIPDGAFRESGTMVRAVIVRIPA